MRSLFNSLLTSTHYLVIIVLLCINVFKLLPGFTNTELFAFVILFLLIVYLIVLLTISHNKERNSKYGEAMGALSSGFAQIHYYNRLNPEQKTDELQQTILSNLCNSVSSAFNILTGSNCSTSIKYMASSNEHPNEIQVKTLCRDQGLGLIRGSNDKFEHLLKENSDFEMIMRKKGIGEGSYFMSNQLPRLLEYKNSSLKYCTYQPKQFGRYLVWNYIVGYLRVIRWPLPYRSCIIVPIIPTRYDPSLSFEVLGFLCVDSKAIRAFRFRHDVDLLKGVADGIYKELDEFLS